MLGTTVREFTRASPFAPFVIQMNDGRRFEVHHPDYALVAPKGEKVFVYDKDENEFHLSALLIASVQLLKQKKSRNGAGKTASH